MEIPKYLATVCMVSFCFFVHFSEFTLIANPILCTLSKDKEYIANSDTDHRILSNSDHSPNTESHPSNALRDGAPHHPAQPHEAAPKLNANDTLHNSSSILSNCGDPQRLQTQRVDPFDATSSGDDDVNSNDTSSESLPVPLSDPLSTSLSNPPTAPSHLISPIITTAASITSGPIGMSAKQWIQRIPLNISAAAPNQTCFVDIKTDRNSDSPPITRYRPFLRLSASSNSCVVVAHQSRGRHNPSTSHYKKHVLKFRDYPNRRKADQETEALKAIKQCIEDPDNDYKGEYILIHEAVGEAVCITQNWEGDNGTNDETKYSVIVYPIQSGRGEFCTLDRFISVQYKLDKDRMKPIWPYIVADIAYPLLLSLSRLRDYLGMMHMDIKPPNILVRLRSVRSAFYGGELDFKLIDLDQTHRVDPEDMKNDPDDEKDDYHLGYGSGTPGYQVPRGSGRAGFRDMSWSWAFIVALTSRRKYRVQTLCPPDFDDQDIHKRVRNTGYAFHDQEYCKNMADKMEGTVPKELVNMVKDSISVFYKERKTLKQLVADPFWTKRYEITRRFINGDDDSEDIDDGDESKDDVRLFVLNDSLF